jgi:hypothetical protein
MGATKESCVRIVGGGLTGILAAFQAHRLGARNIELFERLDQLGGVALPEVRDMREMREGCVYFGPKDDPIRTLLEEHGARFEDFDNRFGSVSASAEGPVYVEDFGGPALAASNIALAPLRGVSLADRLACFDDSLAFPLARYVRWHLGCNPALLHGSAAVPLAINRVYPTGASLDALSEAKRTDNLANELFGIPRSMWNYANNVKASLPVGGFTGLFRQCRAALEAIGVRISERTLATPRAALSQHSPGDVLIWAASPMPLFKALGMDAPKAPAKRFATYTFEADWTGALPFYVQNFTTSGSCFRVYIYESAGRVLLTAECVVEDARDTLIGDIRRMLEGFDGRLKVGEQLFQTVKPRWLYHSVETIDRLAQLRAALAARLGTGCVPGAWEAYGKGEKFAEVDAALRTALGIKAARAA